MSLLSQFDSQQLKSILRLSNYWASYNRNQYPEKMQGAIDELYEWVDCPCDGDCQCKQHGCEKHLVRRSGIGFDQYLHHFLNCYVDQNFHESVMMGRTSGRGARAVPIIEVIRGEWKEEYSHLSAEKSLICTEWSVNPYDGFSKEFLPSGENIYMSKWMTLLSLNTYVAYDNGSLSLLNRDFDNPETYYVLMHRIRTDLITHLQNFDVSIMDFLLYDDPGEFFCSVPRGAFRPLGNIIDKFYLTL